VIVTEPTVAKLMVLPCRLPWTLSVTEGSENVIVPLRFDPDCCHLRVNACVSTPLESPDHVPETSAEVAGAVVAATRVVGGAVDAGVLDLTVLVVADDERVLEEPHAAPRMSRTAAIPLPSKVLLLITWY
jgi:hypothetical protein